MHTQTQGGRLRCSPTSTTVCTYSTVLLYTRGDAGTLLFLVGLFQKKKPDSGEAVGRPSHDLFPNPPSSRLMTRTRGFREKESRITLEAARGSDSPGRRPSTQAVARGARPLHLSGGGDRGETGRYVWFCLPDFQGFPPIRSDTSWISRY